MASLVDQMIGEYRIVRLLGAGGMGEVYQAVHIHLGRVIAIKVLSPDLADGPALERFYSEAAIQASLKHPGVAEYLGFYQFGDRPCILMEYVDGETLSSSAAFRGASTTEAAVRVLHQISTVVAHFHKYGVVHRDLKASNVKICPDGRVKILDFGIARHQKHGRITRAGAVIGTLESLAPEQVRGEAPTAATDVWQLGVMFYELLTGRSPFASSSTQETYAHILAAEFAPVDRLGQTVPPAIEKIVDRCLQKDPKRRYRDASELCNALGALDGQDPGTRPAIAQRSWLVPVLSAAVMLVIAAGTYRSCGRTPIRGEGEVASSSDSSSAAGNVEAPRPASSVVIDTVDGPAQVFIQGKLAGATPYRVDAHAGDRVEVVLKRAGFRDLPVQFETSERRNYTFALEAAPER